MISVSYTKLESVPSTSTSLLQQALDLPSGSVFYTPNQSAGRGQRGNSWESEPGKNLTFSFLFKGFKMRPSQQFFISEAVSLAIIEVLERHAKPFTIKWPNDIYYGNKKIAGILHENAISGTEVLYSVIGIGININQEKFLSDAPNPVSLIHVTSKEEDTDAILREFCEAIAANLFPLTQERGIEEYCSQIHELYLKKLYRRDGKLHPFLLPNGRYMDARIDNVAPDGRITLIDAAGYPHDYYFKEVAFDLSDTEEE